MPRGSFRVAQNEHGLEDAELEAMSDFDICALEGGDLGAELWVVRREGHSAASFGFSVP